MSASDHLLLVSQNLDNHLEDLGGRCQAHRYYNADDRESLFDAVGDKIRIVGTNGHDGCSRDLMQRLPNLEMIGCYDAVTHLREMILPRPRLAV